jgi:hypothetical protein
VSAAGAAEEMYMVKGIETFKTYDENEAAAKLGGAQVGVSERTSYENTLKEADIHHHELGLFANTAIDGHNSVGRLGVWIAVAVGLLGFKWLFPHYVKKAQELLAHPYELYQMLKFKFAYTVQHPSLSYQSINQKITIKIFWRLCTHNLQNRQLLLQPPDPCFIPLHEKSYFWPVFYFVCLLQSTFIFWPDSKNNAYFKYLRK